MGRRVQAVCDCGAATPLDLDDLERLALAAYLSGHDEESTLAWTRAHHDAIRRDDPQPTGQQLWNWTIGGNPIPGMLVADVTDEQRADVIRVLDGMVRERSGGTGPAVLTAPLNIEVGTK